MSTKRTLEPELVDASYYWERVDRNMGIITPEEQEKLRQSTIGVAGCGGMGGLVAAQLARIGIGRLKIADCEVFDVSNLNRQFGARFDSIGRNKAAVTAEEIRRITPDVHIDVYEAGVTQENAGNFVDGCDVLCDEIELFAVKPRLLLHQAARRAGISLYCCDVVGFGTRIFFFTPTSMTMEEFLGLTGEESFEPWIVRQLIDRFAPELCNEISEETITTRFIEQKKAAIFGGTPLLSAGILIDCLTITLLGRTKCPWVVPVPEMPGYCLFDAGEWKTSVVRGQWW